ncbi:MAG TPA: hypothetical protein VJ762_08370 [Sphingobium sp.]|nr:hypothetical protein [Sphingobium sp.]
MAIVNPRHLLEQSESLASASPDRPLRQADLRRAISAAYYGVFHYMLTAGADQFVGSDLRKSRRYTLVYRSVDHRSLRDICMEAKKSTPGAKYQKYVPKAGFGEEIQSFANMVLELQEKRHDADYDPSQWVTRTDAKLALTIARSAIERFESASLLQRKYFLTLLLFSPR